MRTNKLVKPEWLLPTEPKLRVTPAELYLFAKSPYLYQMYRQGNYPSPLEIDRMAEAFRYRILMGSLAFNEKYTPFLRNSNQIFITKSEADKIEKVAMAAVRGTSAFNAVCGSSAGFKGGFVNQYICRMVHNINLATGIDIYYPVEKLVVKLYFPVNIDNFVKEAKQNAYGFEAGFTMQCIPCCNNDIKIKWVAIEREKPYRCGVWRVEPIVINYYSRLIFNLCATMRASLLNNVWPSDYENELSFIDITYL